MASYYKGLFLYFLSFSFDFMAPLLVPLLIEAGSSRRDATTVQGIAYLISALTIPFLGRALDKGRQYSVIAVACIALLLAPALLTLGINHNTKALAAVLVIVAGGVVMLVGGRSLEAMVPTSERTRAATLTYLAMNIGGCIASGLAYYFMKSGRSDLLWLDALTSTLFTLWAARYFSRMEHKNTTIPSLGKEARQATISSPWQEARQATVPLLGCFLIMPTIFAHISAIPSLYDRQFGASIQPTALMFAVNGLTVIFSGVAFKKIFASFGESKRLTTGTILLAAGHAAVPFAISLPASISSTIVWSLGEVMLWPILTTTILSLFDSSASGFASAIKVTLVRMGLVAAPLMSTLIDSIPLAAFSVVFGSLPLLGLLLLQLNAQRTEVALTNVVGERE